MAGAAPSKITVDSNLDWGQDIYRLQRTVRELGIETLAADLFSNLHLEAHGLRLTPLSLHVPTYGWVAISEHRLRMSERTGDYAWLRYYRPARRIGRSILLYYIPPPSSS